METFISQLSIIKFKGFAGQEASFLYIIFTVASVVLCYTPGMRPASQT